jgi:hypothetical protein
MRRLHCHRLLPDFLGNATLLGDRPLGLKPRGPVKPPQGLLDVFAIG